MYCSPLFLMYACIVFYLAMSAQGHSVRVGEPEMVQVEAGMSGGCARSRGGYKCICQWEDGLHALNALNRNGGWILCSKKKLTLSRRYVKSVLCYDAPRIDLFRAEDELPL